MKKVLSISVRHGYEDFPIEEITIEDNKWSMSDFNLKKLSVFSPECHLVFTIRDEEESTE